MVPVLYEKLNISHNQRLKLSDLLRNLFMTLLRVSPTLLKNPVGIERVPISPNNTHLLLLAIILPLVAQALAKLQQKRVTLCLVGRNEIKTYIVFGWEA